MLFFDFKAYNGKQKQSEKENAGTNSSEQGEEE